MTTQELEQQSERTEQQQRDSTDNSDAGSKSDQGSAKKKCTDTAGIIAMSEDNSESYSCSQLTHHCDNEAIAAQCPRTCGRCGDGQQAKEENSRELGNDIYEMRREAAAQQARSQATQVAENTGYLSAEVQQNLKDEFERESAMRHTEL